MSGPGKSSAEALVGKNILVTGGAGFIGSHLVDALLKSGNHVTVLDNFNDYYESSIKRQNILNHLKYSTYRLIEGDVRDKAKVAEAFSHGPFVAVVHLAALAGVRQSIERPAAYMDVNINGTQLLIDESLRNAAGRLVFGSSSSVYGERSKGQFLETDKVDRPLSPYAASKAAGELLCHAAHHTRGLPVVCLRFFTVYGPRQRPDLAIHKFCRLIEANKPLEVYGDGHSKRDYTYVDDTVSGIITSITYDLPGYDVINLGCSRTVELLEMIRILEKALGKSAKLIHKEFRSEDMPYTYANIDRARQVLGYDPGTAFETGIQRFVEWYQQSSPLTARLSETT
ncbi:MAG: epimerase [Candidatus Melainabacteria bacterium]|nr:MAG: epimerase [Candidatus Melainabacteria bacterium]